MKKRKVIIITVLALILVSTAVAFGVIAPYYSNQIEIVEKPPEIVQNNTENVVDTTLNIEKTEELEEDKLEEPVLIYKEEQKADEIINILLCGMDARRYEDQSRSDTIILASYNKTQHTVKLFSFMRDTWVYMPDMWWSKINAATFYGGTGLLVNTLNHNFDLDIQNYVQIKFDDFKEIIDSIGGIEVELTQNEIWYINNKLHTEDRDWNNDIKEKPGVINLNGTQALWHCRNRSIGNSDFERTDRQREVLSIIINKLTDMTLGEATNLVLNLRDNVNTNIPLETIFALGKDAILTGDLTIESYRIPYENTFVFANKNGASVIELDMEKTIEMLHEQLGYTNDNLDITEDDIESTTESSLSVGTFE